MMVRAFSPFGAFWEGSRGVAPGWDVVAPLARREIVRGRRVRMKADFIKSQSNVSGLARDAVG
jgi:hypothetical protein